MLSIVIPIYNEQDNLSLLYESLMVALKPVNQSFEIVLVNDGSVDQSERVLTELASKDQRVKVINFRRNFGQTAAMMAGIDYAAGDIIIPMDGDMQNDPADIPKLLAKLDEGYDVVSGWRRDRKDHKLKRTFPSRLANFLISRISGVRLHDYGCSLKAYRKQVIKGIKLYGEMHRFVPIYATWQGAKVTEILVNHRERMHGSSKYGLERVLKVVLDLVVVKFLAKYSNTPIYVFGGFGFVCIGISIMAGLLAVYLKLFHHTSFILTPLPLLVVMSFITGIMSILMGLLAEIIMRTYYESQSKPVYLVKNILNINDKP
jgi:glycosyltransferase involved in cell wall biosynthesis